MNSTLGSVVPLAMFELGQAVLIFSIVGKIPIVEDTFDQV